METLTKIPYLTILFNNDLKPFEVPAFRGAIISKIPKELTLFHNHNGDTFRFSYPLIQYKTIGKKAALFCIGEGTKEIAYFFSNADLRLKIGEREENFSVKNVWANQWLLQTWEDTFYYSISRWLPLNQKNYLAFSSTDSIVEHTKLLESILTGNLLSMSKGLSHYFESRVSSTITGIEKVRQYPHKGVLMQGFDIKFKSNIFLPDFIGLGRGSSMGFGIVKAIKSQNQVHGYDNEK